MAKQIAQIFGYQSHQMISSDKHGGPVNSTFHMLPGINAKVLSLVTVNLTHLHNRLSKCHLGSSPYFEEIYTYR